MSAQRGVLYLSEFLIGRTESHIHVSVLGRYRSPEACRLNSPTQSNLQVRLSLVISDPFKKIKTLSIKAFYF